MIQSIVPRQRGYTCSFYKSLCGLDARIVVFEFDKIINIVQRASSAGGSEQITTVTTFLKVTVLP